MKMRTGITTLAAVLALAGCGSDKEPNRVVGELTSDRYELTAEVAEPITTINIAEGESVAADQVLLSQDDTRARARLAEATAALAQQQARLDELVRGPRAEQIAAARANVEGATQDLEFRQTEMTRVEDIHARGLASPDQLDQASAGVDAAQANLKLRLAQLEEMLAGTTIEELAQAEQAVAQLAARRDAIQVDLDRHTIRAPVAGVADSRLFEAGERPSPGQPLMIVLGGEQPYARVFVPETIRVHITSGTAAVIHVDGLDEPLDGRVRWVSSESAFTPYFALTEHDRGRLSYVAKVDITTNRERLPDGVPVEVEFLID
ncbi:MAG: HlyD family efflux transporter periplasmic adaptor subunit [Gammaproteobacteria bacterium]|jgi:HlyD family secretion protein|nr:HlyD family efflux transporter periplasmic adaptor subunit [Gammaproteobacteria bacterium]